jgi:hypothetical protein
LYIDYFFQLFFEKNEITDSLSHFPFELKVRLILPGLELFALEEDHEDDLFDQLVAVRALHGIVDDGALDEHVACKQKFIAGIKTDDSILGGGWEAKPRHL